MIDRALIRRFGDLSVENAAALDRATDDCGVGVDRLMDLAGWQVARCAWLLLGGGPGVVTVMAGRGNNGGDALVSARHLHDWGCQVCVLIVTGGRHLSALAAARRHLLAADAGLEMIDLDTDAAVDAIRPRVDAAGLVIDGIFGTGLRAAPDGVAASAIRVLGIAPVLSIDVPSGFDPGSGEARTPAVRAMATCTLAAMKSGLWSDAGRDLAGLVWVADIGIPARAWRFCHLERPVDVAGGELARVPETPTTGPKQNDDTA